MKLKAEQLAFLLRKRGDGVDIKYFDDVVVKGNCFLSTDLVMPSHLTKLMECNIDEVEVFYNHVLYEHLVREFPAEFRKPYGKVNMTEMDRLLEDLQKANSQSRRKRYIRMVGDIFGLDMNLGKQAILLRHNELLDFKKWNNLKRDFDRNQVFQYRNSEVPIIIFVDLNMHSEREYIERFKINTDLISLIVSRSQEQANIIAPDFIPTEDVMSVTDPATLFDEYIRSNARLIIIGEKLDDSYKRALLHVRNYDRFVRLLVVPALDHRNSPDFFHQVRLVYNYNRWQ